MSDICIYIQLPNYLAQWFIHEQGGNFPVRLIRGCMESKILETFLTKTPAGVVPDVKSDGKVAIVIPSFKNKDPRTYNFLSEAATGALVDCIANRFDIKLWQDLHRFGFIGKRQDKLITAWMENNGIEDDSKNWDTIAKRYQRMRNIYLSNKRVQKLREKNTRV